MAYNQQQHQQQGGQYGDQLHSSTDEYGNPVTQLDQFGNPTSTAAGGLAGVGSHQGTGTGTGYGTGGGDTGYGATTGGGTGVGYGSTDQGAAGYGGATGTGHHEQRGVMDKIKEKIPGTTESGATGPAGYGNTTTTGGTGGTGYGGTHGTGTGTGTGGHHEQKGMMDKIKEKIPCATGDTTTDQYSHGTGGAGYGTGTGTGTGQHYTAGGDGRQHHDQYSHGTTGEKKGIVGKIKEKLPGVGGGGGHSDNKY